MERWKEVAVGGRSMRCYRALPALPDAPCLLVCMHGPGVDPFIQDICERLAAHGIAASAPDLYHRQAEPLEEAWTKVRDSEALEDLTAALHDLKATPGVDPSRAGVLGFCMGGRLAFLFAAHQASLRAAVMFHGGNLFVARDGLPSPFDQAERVSAPVLGLFGADDKNPSVADVERIEAELTRLGKRHTFHTYAGAGHAFLNFTRPAVFRPEQAKDAWDLCLRWLDQHL